MDCCKNVNHLYILEDGTLDVEQKRHLKEALVKVTIINKSDRDHYINPILSDYPLLSKFRTEVILAQKLIDPLLFADKMKIPILNFIDTDVYFYNNCTLPSSDGNFSMFMKDNDSGYSFRIFNSLRYFFKFKIHPQINTGLFSLPIKWFTLNSLEKLLAIKSLRNDLDWCKVWAEQTLWAILASRHDVCFYDETEIKVATNNISSLQPCSSIHFVSSFRNLFVQKSSFSRMVEIQYKPSRTTLNYLKFISLRIFKRITK